MITTLAANLNSHRGSNYERKPMKSSNLNISNDLIIPNIAVNGYGQSILTPKRTIEANKLSIQN